MKTSFKNDSPGKGKNWPHFDFCNQFLQTKSGLKKATEDLLLRLRGWNVAYAEIRFCPELHRKKNLSPDEIVESVTEGFSLVPEVGGGIIISALRSLSPEHSVAMAELADRHAEDKGGRVVGFDICGFEPEFPLNDESSNMYEGVQRALELRIPVTLHSGEWPEDGNGQILKNVEFALESGAKRIGHGIAIGNHPRLFQRAKDKLIEVCLTSNVAFGHKVPSYAEHPVKKFYKERIPFSLSCDNLLMSGDSDRWAFPAGEILHLVEDVFQDDEESGWEAVKFSLLCGVRGAFSRQIDESWTRNFLAKVDAVLSKRGKQEKPKFLHEAAEDANHVNL